MHRRSLLLSVPALFLASPLRADDRTFYTPGLAEAAMDAAITAFLETGPDPDAFARIKTQIRAADIYARDDAEGLARRYGEGLSNGLSVEDIKDWPAVLDAVTPEDVLAAAKLVFDRKAAVTGYLIKEEAAQ